ncbi:MAG: hypothetical protein IPJ65_36090 [Archangiaceae bacterium]|nr:hypothetical protein [Archangiaceae bacterium]
MDVELNDTRKVAIATRVLEYLRDRHLLAMPAGLLRAASREDVGRVARPLVQAARERGAAIVFGVDSPGASWLVAATPRRKAMRVWSVRAEAPVVLELGRYRVAVLSAPQFETAAARKAAIDAQPELVVLCGRDSYMRRLHALRRFTKRGVLVTPSTWTLTCEGAPLVGPLGYRHPNLRFGEGGMSVSCFDLSDSDWARAAA